MILSLDISCFVAAKVSAITHCYCTYSSLHLYIEDRREVYCEDTSFLEIDSSCFKWNINYHCSFTRPETHIDVL